MPWPGLFLVLACFAAFGYAENGAGGAAIGGGFILLIAVARFSMEWADRYGSVGRLRRRCARFSTRARV